MKLATLKDGSRDGQLVVVSRDLGLAHFATGIATRLQQALDDWNFVAPQLEDLYATLNGGKARHALVFDARHCMAPLPRACQRVGGSAHPRHLSEPLLYQGGSDDLQGATDAARFADEAAGIDFEAGLAVITGDLAPGATPEAALEGVRLLMLTNDWSLRHLMAAEAAQGFGFVQSRPATAFSPVAVTPDELGEAWAGGRVQLELECRWNGRRFGLCEAGSGMKFHFGQLIAHLAGTRRVRAGSIIGSGSVGSPDGVRGCACIAEQRAIETVEGAATQTDFMRFGDSVRIEMNNRQGQSVFGAIEQRVQRLGD